MLKVCNLRTEFQALGLQIVFTIEVLGIIILTSQCCIFVTKGFDALLIGRLRRIIGLVYDLGTGLVRMRCQVMIFIGHGVALSEASAELTALARASPLGRADS